MREPSKRITPEQVQAANAEAYEKGKNDATAQAERRTAAAPAAIADAASAVPTRRPSARREARMDFMSDAP